ncbi:hypothetical protein AaE_014632 [Aphanomyces astaci]|uniref:Myb-like domain-containing protein n=1 Tax=Aphanomyces astaci TaxID=112090 RepID=A0A6A4Z4S7_APHAT|nr:hypothetical protein AaE_014632 [Aphanomyces astaci]
MSNDLGIDTTDTQARKWWSDSDDLSLLTQVNNDLPFKQVKNTTKAWDALATKLLEVPGFGRTTLDGKKAANRFYQLLRVHRRFQQSSQYLSGVEQEETGKIVLLDELVQLFDEATDQRNADRAAMHAKVTEKEAAASFLRDQAMQSGKRKSVETDESTDSDVVGRKRKAIFESHDLRDQAMQSGKRKSVETDESTDSDVVGRKRKAEARADSTTRIRDETKR